MTTPTEDSCSYNIENVEDADYYTEEQAAMIKTVAMNGYWGTQDDPATEKLEAGSLASMKAMMENARDDQGNPVFTTEEIALLNDGIAMTATQYAIWTFSNAMSEIEFVNVQYIQKNQNNEKNSGISNVPEEEQASVDLIFKLYEYMIHMEPTRAEENTTANTVINPEHFLNEVTLTVTGKAENHANNQDTDSANDAYVTDLSFDLAVTPDTENGDELVVEISDAEGNVMASGRVAGEANEGETVLEADENGFYSFRNLILTEGEQNFSITMKGMQHLAQGVYLYTSENRDGTTSQTMVGIAEGDRAVDVSMEITFQLDVQDAVNRETHVWRTEWSKPGGGSSGGGSGNGANGGGEPSELPKTGDTMPVWLFLNLFSGAALMGLYGLNKQKRYV